jgi:hypothetical protein
MICGCPDVDGLEIVFEPALLEHDEDFLHVGAGQSIEIDHERSSTRLNSMPALAPHRLRPGVAAAGAYPVQPPETTAWAWPAQLTLFGAPESLAAAGG